MDYSKDDLVVIYQALCEVSVKGQFVEQFAELKRKVKEHLEKIEKPTT